MNQMVTAPAYTQGQPQIYAWDETTGNFKALTVSDGKLLVRHFRLKLTRPGMQHGW